MRELARIAERARPRVARAEERLLWTHLLLDCRRGRGRGRDLPPVGAASPAARATSTAPRSSATTTTTTTAATAAAAATTLAHGPTLGSARLSIGFGLGAPHRVALGAPSKVDIVARLLVYHGSDAMRWGMGRGEEAGWGGGGSEVTLNKYKCMLRT